MYSAYFPAPSIKPLERLNVYDSLMINAQRWSLAHTYHRQRQNVHYQSLNQPGIVCGLGVTIIEPPDSTDSRFRDQRWIEIQPGIAIDVEGNVIVVDETVDRTYRIAAKPLLTGSMTVYVVVSYVEPDVSHHQPRPDVVREQFRFDQKTTPPEDHEIELCRIQLAPNFSQIELPEQVFFPGLNQLDVNHRLQAQAKPIATVRAAQVQPPHAEFSDQFNPKAIHWLTQSTSALYPQLQGMAAAGVLPLQAEAIAPYDLLILAGEHLSDLSSAEQDTLSTFLEQGRVLLIELPDLQDAIAHWQNWIAHTFQISLESWQTLPDEHPLRSHPFLFAAPPEIDQSSLQIWCCGGIILVMGELSSAWAPDVQRRRSRNDIRTAQEFGINILHFAWRRRHLTQALQPALL